MLGFGGKSGRPARTRARPFASPVPLQAGHVFQLPGMGLLAPVNFLKLAGAPGGHANLSVGAATGAITAGIALGSGATQTINGTATGADGCVIPWSVSLTGAVAPIEAPAAPLVTLTAINGGVEIDWTDGDDGGAAITGHKLYVDDAPGVTIADLHGTILTAPPYVLDGLAVGEPIYVRMSAVNSAGEGNLSEEETATPTGITFPAVSYGYTDDFESNPGLLGSGTVASGHVAARVNWDFLPGVTGVSSLSNWGVHADPGSTPPNKGTLHLTKRNATVDAGTAGNDSGRLMFAPIADFGGGGWGRVTLPRNNYTEANAQPWFKAGEGARANAFNDSPINIIMMGKDTNNWLALRVNAALSRVEIVSRLAGANVAAAVTANFNIRPEMLPLPDPSVIEWTIIPNATGQPVLSIRLNGRYLQLSGTFTPPFTQLNLATAFPTLAANINAGRRPGLFNTTNRWGVASSFSAKPIGQLISIDQITEFVTWADATETVGSARVKGRCYGTPEAWGFRIFEAGTDNLLQDWQEFEPSSWADHAWEVTHLPIPNLDLPVNYTLEFGFLEAGAMHVTRSVEIGAGNFAPVAGQSNAVQQGLGLYSGIALTANAFSRISGVGDFQPQRDYPFFYVSGRRPYVAAQSVYGGVKSLADYDPAGGRWGTTATGRGSQAIMNLMPDAPPPVTAEGVPSNVWNGVNVNFWTSHILALIDGATNGSRYVNTLFFNQGEADSDGPSNDPTPDLYFDRLKSWLVDKVRPIIGAPLFGIEMLGRIANGADPIGVNTWAVMDQRWQKVRRAHYRMADEVPGCFIATHYMGIDHADNLHYKSDTAYGYGRLTQNAGWSAACAKGWTPFDGLGPKCLPEPERDGKFITIMVDKNGYGTLSDLITRSTNGSAEAANAPAQPNELHAWRVGQLNSATLLWTSTYAIASISRVDPGSEFTQAQIIIELVNDPGGPVDIAYGFGASYKDHTLFWGQNWNGDAKTRHDTALCPIRETIRTTS